MATALVQVVCVPLFIIAQMDRWTVENGWTQSLATAVQTKRISWMRPSANPEARLPAIIQVFAFPLKWLCIIFSRMYSDIDDPSLASNNSSWHSHPEPHRAIWASGVSSTRITKSINRLKKLHWMVAVKRERLNFAISPPLPSPRTSWSSGTVVGSNLVPSPSRIYFWALQHCCSKNLTFLTAFENKVTSFQRCLYNLALKEANLLFSRSYSVPFMQLWTNLRLLSWTVNKLAKISKWP